MILSAIKDKVPKKRYSDSDSEDSNSEESRKEDKRQIELKLTKKLRHEPLLSTPLKQQLEGLNPVDYLGEATTSRDKDGFNTDYTEQNTHRNMTNM